MSNPYDTVTARTSILGPTIRFKGDLSAEEDVIIHGSLEGSITHTRRLTIGPQGTVHANVEAQQVFIEGTLEGDVHAEASVSIKENARMTGNIAAPAVAILEGATFNGHVDMAAGGTAAAESAPPGRKSNAA